MELYQFLFVAAFLQFFTLKTLIICAFTLLMSKHLHKKYIINYEIKGQHKTITKICNYPIQAYNKIASYNYNKSTLLLYILYPYNKINSYYLIGIDEVIHMFSDLLLDVVKELMDKSTKIDTKKSNENDMINNLFNSMVHLLPKKNNNNVSKTNNNNLLNIIKKENKLDMTKPHNNISDKLIDNSDSDSDELKFTLLDNINLDNLNDDKLNELNSTLTKYKSFIKKEIDDIYN